jgi:hypothetical protein
LAGPAIVQVGEGQVELGVPLNVTRDPVTAGAAVELLVPSSAAVPRHVEVEARASSRDR